MPELKKPKRVQIPAMKPGKLGLAQTTKDLLKKLEEDRKRRDKAVNKT